MRLGTDHGMLARLHRLLRSRMARRHRIDSARIAPLQTSTAVDRTAISTTKRDPSQERAQVGHPEHQDMRAVDPRGRAAAETCAAEWREIGSQRPSRDADNSAGAPEV